MKTLLPVFLSLLLASETCRAQEPVAADTSKLDYKQFGLLAIQDGGRRKPIDTFARETLIRLTGRSTYTDKAGRKWTANDFVLSALLDTHDWKDRADGAGFSGQIKGATRARQNPEQISRSRNWWRFRN